MKIIKTLKAKNGHPYNWGLGENGELYYQWVEISVWRPYNNAEWGISLREMKEIVKTFGHLIIFT
jgi:hypothetical protein